MAVSFRIVMFLVSLSAFGFMYAIFQLPVGVLEGVALDHATTDQGHEGISHMQLLWFGTPVFILLGSAAWLLKQGVIIK